MNELTIRAKSSLKITNGTDNVDLTAPKGVLLEDFLKFSPPVIARNKKIDQLQRQNDELVAKLVKLEVAASMDMTDAQNTGVVRMDRLREYFGNPSNRKHLTESLAEIEAAAVENAKVSSQMKAECMGEISLVIENGNCCPHCWHEPDDDCDICHGESGEGGSSNLLVQVPWETMKDIWKLMNQSYARQLRQQSTNDGSDGDG